jgi:hypothetical protein
MVAFERFLFLMTIDDGIDGADTVSQVSHNVTISQSGMKTKAIHGSSIDGFLCSRLFVQHFGEKVKKLSLEEFDSTHKKPVPAAV